MLQLSPTNLAFYFEGRGWKSFRCNLTLLTVARAPGFQIRNPAVAARGHTDRGGRTGAASWRRLFQSASPTLRDPSLPETFHLHLQDSDPGAGRTLDLEDNFFSSDIPQHLWNNKTQQLLDFFLYFTNERGVEKV